MFGQMLVLALALLPPDWPLPPCISSVPIYFGMLPAVVLAALAAAILLATEAAIGVRLLGKAFERFDWSEGWGSEDVRLTHFLQLATRQNR